MSTLTIELDSSTENQLRQRSLAEGRNQEEIAAHLLARALHTRPLLSPQEISLLQTAREELPDAHWKRYRKLGRKSKAGTILPEEYAELAELGNQIEVHHAKRLQAVFVLAGLWNQDFDETMKLLGVGPRNG